MEVIYACVGSHFHTVVFLKCVYLVHIYKYVSAKSMIIVDKFEIRNFQYYTCNMCGITHSYSSVFKMCILGTHKYVSMIIVDKFEIRNFQ